MKLDTYLDILRDVHGGPLPLNDDQRLAVSHPYDRPLWIIAGPGTGKTHTLVWLTLKRILVDGVDPSRIILTTFTRKAAAELESRLLLSRQKLVAGGVHEAESIDLSRITLGTLHSICSRVLQDQRYEPTLRISEYLSFSARLLLAFGVTFELPVVAFFLARVGMIDHNTLIRPWRYALIGIVVIAAVLTPGPDVASQLLLVAPLVVLYGVSIGVAYVFRNEQARGEEQAEQESDEPA